MQLYTISSLVYRRDAASLVNPKNKHIKKIPSDSQVSNIVQNDQSKNDSELNKHSSKATRHLFLIRHGQYEINNNESEKKVLTMLGKYNHPFDWILSFFILIKFVLLLKIRTRASRSIRQTIFSFHQNINFYYIKYFLFFPVCWKVFEFVVEFKI